MKTLLLWLAVVLLAGCGGESPKLQRGQPVPGFELERLEGGTLAFPADLQDKVVAIRFWADWCPFCETEMHDIEPLYRKYHARGLEILALNVRQDRETAAAFIGKLGISYGVLLDREGAVARGYGVIGLPTTVFVDRRGRLARRILGESTPDVFEGIVKELL